MLEVFTRTRCLNMKLLLTIILFDTFCYFDLTNIIYTFYFYAFVFLFFPLKKISSLSFHFICSLLSSTRHLSTQMPLLHTDVFAVCISTVKDVNFLCLHGQSGTFLLVHQSRLVWRSRRCSCVTGGFECYY